jgi:UDP-N-acetylmuramoylalanine--D-glutamate ligase
MSAIKNQHILVIGSGLSGISAVKLLSRLGAIAIIYDSNENASIEEIRKKLPPDINPAIYLGDLPPDILNMLKMAVISPGVPLESPHVKMLTTAGVPVIGEIELAYRHAKGRIIAITGTNGKTTTATLAGEIMKAHFPVVFIVGNIGSPFCEIALETTAETVIVLEVSSFQLETIRDFAPQIAAILNITPDHLDRHGSMQNYVTIKERIAENQGESDTCIINYDSEYSAPFAAKCPALTIAFSATREINNGCYLKDGTIYESKEGKSEALITAAEIRLTGTCNLENVMVAILIARRMDVPLDTILRTVKNFRAVAHRIEYVATKAGVDYYNDSKATNPDAAIQGISAMAKPAVLLAGGSDKSSDYMPWLLAGRERIKALVLVGETKDAIAIAAAQTGISNIHKAKTFTEALTLCKDIAVTGDCVLLSPACASLDMFKNYEERGDVFKNFVNEL